MPKELNSFAGFSMKLVIESKFVGNFFVETLIGNVNKVKLNKQ